jgi:hypothetical protein
LDIKRQLEDLSSWEGSIFSAPARGNPSTIPGNFFHIDRGNPSTIPKFLPRSKGKSFHDRGGRPSAVTGKTFHPKGEILPP